MQRNARIRVYVYIQEFMHACTGQPHWTTIRHYQHFHSSYSILQKITEEKALLFSPLKHYLATSVNETNKTLIDHIFPMQSLSLITFIGENIKTNSKRLDGWYAFSFPKDSLSYHIYTNTAKQTGFSAYQLTFR